MSYNANKAHCCWWWPSGIKPLVYYFRSQAGEVIINYARPPLGSLNAGWDSFDLNRILTVSSLFSSKVSRACTCHILWRDMETMDQILQGTLSLLLRCDLSTSSSLFSLFSYWIILRHIYFSHASTTMTSEKSQNTIFVRFYTSISYLTLSEEQGRFGWKQLSARQHWQLASFDKW